MPPPQLAPPPGSRLRANLRHTQADDALQEKRCGLTQRLHHRGGRPRIAQEVGVAQPRGPMPASRPPSVRPGRPEGTEARLRPREAAPRAAPPGRLRRIAMLLSSWAGLPGGEQSEPVSIPSRGAPDESVIF